MPASQFNGNVHSRLGRVSSLAREVLVEQMPHGVLELLIANHAVAVLVGLVQDDLPHFLINFVALILLR